MDKISNLLSNKSETLTGFSFLNGRICCFSLFLYLCNLNIFGFLDCFVCLLFDSGQWRADSPLERALCMRERTLPSGHVGI